MLLLLLLLLLLLRLLPGEWRKGKLQLEVAAAQTSLEVHSPLYRPISSN